MFGKDSIGKYVYVEEISRCHFLDRNYSFVMVYKIIKVNLLNIFRIVNLFERDKEIWKILY